MRQRRKAREVALKVLYELDILNTDVKEAIELCLEVEQPISNEFIGVQKVAVNA